MMSDAMRLHGNGQSGYNVSGRDMSEYGVLGRIFVAEVLYETTLWLASGVRAAGKMSTEWVLAKYITRGVCGIQQSEGR